MRFHTPLAPQAVPLGVQEPLAGIADHTRALKQVAEEGATNARKRAEQHPGRRPNHGTHHDASASALPCRSPQGEPGVSSGASPIYSTHRLHDSSNGERGCVERVATPQSRAGRCRGCDGALAVRARELVAEHDSGFGMVDCVAGARRLRRPRAPHDRRTARPPKCACVLDRGGHRDTRPRRRMVRRDDFCARHPAARRGHDGRVHRAPGLTPLRNTCGPNSPERSLRLARWCQTPRDHGAPKRLNSRDSRVGVAPQGSDPLTVVTKLSTSRRLKGKLRR